MQRPVEGVGAGGGGVHSNVTLIGEGNGRGVGGKKWMQRTHHVFTA